MANCHQRWPWSHHLIRSHVKQTAGHNRLTDVHKWPAVSRPPLPSWNDNLLKLWEPSSRFICNAWHNGEAMAEAQRVEHHESMFDNGNFSSFSITILKTGGKKWIRMQIHLAQLNWMESPKKLTHSMWPFVAFRSYVAPHSVGFGSVRLTVTFKGCDTLSNRQSTLLVTCWFRKRHDMTPVVGSESRTCDGFVPVTHTHSVYGMYRACNGTPQLASLQFEYTQTIYLWRIS